MVFLEVSGRRDRMGMKAEPVVVVSDIGKYKLAGKYAIKVRGNDSDDTIGGVPSVVYPVTQAQIDSGEFELIQGEPVDVAQVSGRGRNSSKWVTPVYDVTGEWPPSGSTPFVGPYDDIPDLVHVYEPARRTLSSYTGNLIRIRRNSDNAEMDFGYGDNGDLDTAAVSDFIGAGSGFVVTVYDQVGGNNITQASAMDQPIYIESGQNSRTIMRFDGTNHYLQVAYSVALSQPFTIYAAAIIDDNDDGQVRNLVFGNVGGGVNRSILGKLNTGSPDDWRISAGSTLNGGAGDTNFNIWAALFNGASSQFWINSISKATGNAGAENAGGITVGAASGGSSAWDGDIAMVAVADPSHDDTERAAMQIAINDYWSAF